MGRRKQVRPHRSLGISERHPAEAESSGRRNNVKLEKDGESIEIQEEPYFVDIDRSSWLAEEHYDVSELVVLNLSIEGEYCGFSLGEEVFRDTRYFMRFKLSDVGEFLGRMRLGHWPVLSAGRINLEFGEKNAAEGTEKRVVMASGYLDGPDEGVSGLVHLASMKFLALRPIIGFTFSEGLKSLRVRVEILRSAFDACESLLDNKRQLWKKSMMSVMTWLRPEVTTSEARYGYTVPAHMDGNSSWETIEDPDAEKKTAGFDVFGFYEAIKPSKKEPMLEDNLPDLLPELRPYQRRAVYWMVEREKKECPNGTDGSQFLSPLCVPVNFINSCSRMYYNPFSGNVSLDPDTSSSCISGGILADEMGLGKTIELLACIFSNRMPSGSEVGHSPCNAIQTDSNQKNKFKRLKRERIECICGSVTESLKYKGLWVQCDVCDAWQHAECVGYSAKRKSREISEEQRIVRSASGNSKNHAKRKEDTKIVLTDGIYICQMCTELLQATESPVVSGATLIVCPTPILPQWHAEIIRHTNPGSLKTCIYEGVKNTSFSDVPVIDISELLTADIVLTTYDVLREDLFHDSDRHESDRRFMRFEKRYPVIPTPLTRVLWWRICLDEAQMVESTSTAATEMALRLHTKYRWCITGTPIQRKLEDLYGLIKFLIASPFDAHRWWTEVIRDPYERGDAGAMAFTHNFFKWIMWRSSKAHVADELQLPPQEVCISWLSLSPIEEHFYKRQHDTCVNDAHEFVENLKNDIRRKGQGLRSGDSLSDHLITVENSKLDKSLLKLRQACCHPQVGSSGLRTLQQSPMTMEEILTVLIDKTKVEGEEALRKFVSALNGLAGIAIIKQDFSLTVSLYKEALAVVDEHSEDFRLDPLLSIHIHHNLHEIIPLAEDSSLQFPSGHSFEERAPLTYDDEVSHEQAKKRQKVIDGNSNLTRSFQYPSVTLENRGDKCCDAKPDVSSKFTCHQLLHTCEDLKQKFLSIFKSKLSVAQQDFRKSYEQVLKAMNERRYQNTAWWLEALDQIEQNKDVSTDFLRKIGEAVSKTLNTSRTSKIASCFRNITTLKYYIQTGLDSLEESRETLLDRLLEIDRTMENPREEDVESVRYCPKCYTDRDGPLCVHCQLDEFFQVYEARLFRINKGKNGEVIASAEEAVDLQKKQTALNHFHQSLSRPDRTSSLSISDSEDTRKKRDVREKVVVSKSPSELEVVLAIIKSNSRGLLSRDSMTAGTKQLLLLEGMRKEYAQARSLAIAQSQVLRAHDEIKMATSRLRVREDDNDKSIDALSPAEAALDVANAQNSSEKFLAQSSLSRIKGQLRYLKGLVQSKQTLQSKSYDNSTMTSTADGLSLPSLKKENNHVAEADEEACPICQEKLSDQKMVFQCGHVTCCKCLFAMTERSIQQGKSHDKWVMCPTCRQHTNYGNIAYADDRQNNACKSSEESANSEASVVVKGSYSTKIEAITRRILWIGLTDPTEKVLVFSSWNDVLDVLEHAFAANGISYVRMKGGRKSHVAVSHFKKQNNMKGTVKSQDKLPVTKPVQVLLLLIQHGANGLNLLEAQHVILVEPLLNPAAEAQAIGRVHRIGQQHKTFVHRFIVKDTVEESIYKLSKSRNADSFISGNRKNQDQTHLTLGDVESLFKAPPSDMTECQQTEGSLMHLPPSVAAAIAAEKRLLESSS